MQFNLVTGTWWVSGTSWMKMLLKCQGAPKWHHSEIKEVNTFTTADFPKTECRESQFYSLSFRQAVAGSKVVLISSPPPPPNFDNSSSVIWFILKVYLPIRQIKTEFTSPITKSTSPRLSDMLQKMQFETQSCSFMVSIWEKEAKLLYYKYYLFHTSWALCLLFFLKPNYGLSTHVWACAEGKNLKTCT